MNIRSPFVTQLRPSITSAVHWFPPFAIFQTLVEETFDIYLKRDDFAPAVPCPRWVTENSALCPGIDAHFMQGRKQVERTASKSPIVLRRVKVLLPSFSCLVHLIIRPVRTFYMPDAFTRAHAVNVLVCHDLPQLQETDRILSSFLLFFLHSNIRGEVPGKKNYRHNLAINLP